MELRICCDLQLFDDTRLSGVGTDPDWRALTDDFAQEDDDQTTALGAVGVRISDDHVIFIFYPEHYKGSAESARLKMPALRQLAAGELPFEEITLAEAE